MLKFKSVVRHLTMQAELLVIGVAREVVFLTLLDHTVCR